jgi:PKD repeat protein
MAGVAPGAVVMPIRVCDADCPLSAIVTGLAYAIDNGADVINLSFGGSFFPISNGMEEAIQDAVDSGITVVAAAGNETRNNDLLPFFPANYDIDGLISVAASDDNDALAAFSNYGATSVDMTAPGEAVIGGWEPDDWAIGSGTSFAAPVVAGVAALVKTLRPDLNPAQVAEMLLASVDVQPSLAGKMVSGGRINAGSAMVLATMPVAVAKVTPSSGILPFTVQLDGGQSFDPVGEISSWSWELPDGSVVAAPQATWAPTKPGEYLATLTVVDSDGLSDSDSVSITATLRPGGTFVDDNEHFAEGAVEAIAAERITNGCNPPGNDRFCPQDVVTRGQMAAFLARALSLPPTAEDFFDDDDGSVFEAAIDKLAAARITVGCNPPANTRFCPNDPVTRGQMAAFLSRAFGLTAGGSDAFRDDDGSVFESAIDRLWTAGITAGCNPPANDRFCPDSPVRRGEMAVFLARALGLTPFYPPPAD